MSEMILGIDVFVVAVQAGSFSATATRLHLTRSAVAKTIGRLEQRLNCRLFHRTTRTQSLTEEGQAFYEHCVRALSELEAGRAILNSGRQEPTGKLKVSAPVQFGRQCVAPVLIALTKRYPGLNVEMSFNDRYVDMIDEGFDLAIRVGTLSDSSTLAARRLGPQHMGLFASPGYFADHGRPYTLPQLEQHAGIIYGRSGMRKFWMLKDDEGQLREVQPTCRVVLDDLQSILDAALAGLGIAWLPYWMIAAQLQGGELVPIFEERNIAADIHLVWPHARHLPAKARVAIDALLSEIGSQLSGTK